MAPTSDERREVAARLRAYPLESVKAEHKCKDPLQLPADVMYDLMDIAGVGEGFDSLLPALADLIDPTCHPVPSDGGFFTCSECGERIGAVLPALGTVLMHHCSHCGARVVKEGE